MFYGESYKNIQFTFQPKVQNEWMNTERNIIFKNCIIYISSNIYISAVKWLIAINCIQNKGFCLPNIFVFCVFLLCIYKYTPHTYGIYFENMYMSIFTFHIIYIINKYI